MEPLGPVNAFGGVVSANMVIFAAFAEDNGTHKCDFASWIMTSMFPSKGMKILKMNAT